MDWAHAPEIWDQTVLFSQRLNAVIPGNHGVRFLDDILSRINRQK